MSGAAGDRHGLRRDLRLADAVGIGFGAIIGAGIFVVTGVAAGIAGPSLLVGLLLAGIAASANALSSAQLAAVYPHAGGSYVYGYELLHPLAGYAAGWMFLASKITAAGAVAIGLAGYLEPLIAGVPPRMLAVGAILVFTLLNYMGVRRSSRVNLFIVVLSLGSLLLFVLATATVFDSTRFTPFAPAGTSGALEAGAILFFAYTGYARIATLGGEVHDPSRTIPRAILITLGGALLLYAAVAVTALGAVGAEALAASSAPLRLAAEASGEWLAVVVSLGGVAAMLGVVLSQLLGLSRMSFAMASRGDLPRGLASVDQRSGVPRRAVLTIGLIAAAFAAIGTLGMAARAASFTILVYYAIANLAALRLPRDRRLYPVVIPLIGLASCVVLALALEWRIIAAGVMLMVIGYALRPLFHWLDRRDRGADSGTARH